MNKKSKKKNIQNEKANMDKKKKKLISYTTRIQEKCKKNP